MIELKNPEQLKRAIELANADRKNLLVQLTPVARKYRVSNRKKNQTYEVTFSVLENKRKFGHCTCPAGELGKACKHLAAAAGLNTCLAEQGLLNRHQPQQQATT
jgi:hypothetical protein